MLQLAALQKAANEGLPVDGYDGFQDSCGHVGQLAKRLIGRREEALELGDGGRSLLAFDADCLIAVHGNSSNPVGFLLDCRERANGERVALGLRLNEGRPLDVERLPGDPDCMLEPGMRGPGVKESLPEEAVALSRVLAVVPAPQVPDGSVGISGHPIDQGLGRPEGLSELLPQ